MAWQESKRYAQVDGWRMAYVERGEGTPIVLLHGNPTSSYVWRSVLPELADLGRCIAPDLIGMGDSEKLPADDQRRYTFIRHREFLDALLEQLGVVSDVTLVAHDWGSALGFDWAFRHPDRVRAIAYMEAFVTPLTWKDYDAQRRDVFERLRSPTGEEIVLEHNLFVEATLPGGIQRTLSEEEMNEYRRAFRAAGEDRLPTLVWPRQIPIDGEPPDVDHIVRSYSGWLARSGLPTANTSSRRTALTRSAKQSVSSFRTPVRETTVTVSDQQLAARAAAYPSVAAVLPGWCRDRDPGECKQTGGRECDDPATGEPKKRGLKMDEGPVLIHLWQIDPSQDAVALQRLKEMFTEIAPDPGFVSARVLESVDRTSIGAVVEMRSVEDRQRLEQLPNVRDTLHNLRGTANIVIRLYHDVASYTTSRPGG